MTTAEHRRKGWIIGLGVGTLLLFLTFASLNAFNWKFLNPATIQQIVLFTALSAVAFVLFVAVLLMLGRNLLKLYADQRSHVMGSRLRTRMLIGAILVSLVPLIFMFVFSYGLMNRAVDRWFTQPVTHIRDDSNRMALELSQYTNANARVEAESIAADLPALAVGKGTLTNRAAVQRILREHQITLQGGFAVLFDGTRAIATLNLPQHAGTPAGIKPGLPEASDPDNDSAPAAPNESMQAIDANDPTESSILAASQRGDNPVLTFAGADFALAHAAMVHAGSGSGASGPGSVVVAIPLPPGMNETMARLRTETDEYYTLMRQRRSVRNTYMILLCMMTSLALFVSSWLALYLSKQVTKPVEALADAMASIAAGSYSRRIGETATGELGDLVNSFNGMAHDLESSRAQVEASTALLSEANGALEARRAELETMLQTIPNGVAMVDPEGRILLTNRALSEMMDPGGQQPFLGQTLATVFPAEIVEALDRLMRRSHRMGSASGEMEMAGPSGAGGSGLGGTLNLLATVAILESTAAREHLGYVIVLENATELLRAQKQSAWKEVARRVAHEIKNPLTPISLNAEQIARHIGRMENNGVESPSIAVIRRCAEVISASVESMRGLVDQFASLAQFPTAQPRPADLNTLIENSLALFAGRTEGTRIVRRLSPTLPLVLADPEAMKRALSNLVDNALEAMQQSLLRELRITTGLLDSGLIELTVADTGTGLTDEMRERLFLPYFSTKQRGTGLGLAIAAKIVQEHGGTIRAEKNDPAGAKFILELRPASAPEPDTSPEPQLALRT